MLYGAHPANPAAPDAFEPVEPDRHSTCWPPWTTPVAAECDEGLGEPPLGLFAHLIVKGGSEPPLGAGSRRQSGLARFALIDEPAHLLDEKAAFPPGIHHLPEIQPLSVRH